MTSVVRSKLTPQRATRSIVRTSVVETLTAGQPGSMRAVIAPAGWGKSTALAQWLVGSTVPVAFVAFDHFDNDPTRCWLHVLTAVGEAGGVETAHMISRLKLPVLPLIAEIVDPLLGLIGDRELLIVFDDVHCVSDAETLESLGAFIDGCLATVSFGIGSRSEPPFGLDRRRVAGELIEVGIRELSMGPDEAAEVLQRASGRSIERRHVEVLTSKSEGWPAGLYLAGLSLRSGRPDDAVVDRFTGNDRHLAQYISAEVLSPLSDEDRQFLIDTAVLRELDPELCDAVRRADDSARRLAEVSRISLFVIPTSEIEGEYRFHHLFQECLLTESNRIDSSAVTQRHRRAAVAYADRNEPIAAMDHAQQAQDWRLAHELFTRFALRLVASGNHSTVARWCSAFPDEVDSDIFVAIKLFEAWEGIFEGDLDASERLCATVQRFVPEAEPTNAFTGDPSQLAIIRAFCHQLRGQLGAANREIEVARSHVVPDVCEAALRFISASTGYWLGEQDEGRFLEVATRFEERDDLYAVLLAYAYVAHTHLDQHSDAKAEAWVNRIFALAEDNDLSPFWYGAFSHLARARLLLTRADYSAAAAEAGTAIEFTKRRHDILTLCLGHLVAAEALHGQNERREAKRHTSLVSDLLEPLDDAGTMIGRLRVVERQLRLAPRPNVARRSDLPIEELSNRELALLRLLPGDLNQRELGAVLQVSFNTIKTYNRSIYRKLGVSSRDAAVAASRAAGLL